MLVLRAARLFDGCSPRLLERPLVFIKDGRIIGVEIESVEPPTDVEVVDLGDVTILPELIDVHVHLRFDAGPNPVARMQADDDPTLLLRMQLAARRALAAGVTTVRDLGDRSYLGVTLRNWFRDGPDIGPEIVAAGPPITVTGGHEPHPELVEKIAARQIAVDPTVGITPDAAARPEVVRFTEGFAPILEHMQQAGVRLVAGTDAGISPAKPHDLLPHAIIVFARAGMTNAGALSAATSVAAEACGLADRKGAVQAGKDADLLAVRGNPIADLAALLDVQAVFRAGQRVRFA